MYKIFCSLLSAFALRGHDLCIYKVYVEGWDVSVSGVFKPHTTLITPSRSPLTTLAGGEALQHTRCSSGAPGHTRTRTRIYKRGDARHSCAQQTAAASLIDPIIRPRNICSSDGLRHSGLLLRRLGCRSIHATTPPA